VLLWGKLLVSCTILGALFRNINWEVTRHLLQTAHLGFLWLALLSFNASQVLSAARLLWFLAPLRVRLKWRENVRLYYVGMFYNLLLPGGISGDAVKIVVLRKRFPEPWKRYVVAFLQDRVNGLVALGAWMVVWTLLAGDSIAGWLLPLGALGWSAGMLGYLLGMRRFFTDFWEVLGRGTLASVGVQGLQIVSVYWILRAFAVTEQTELYFLLFLASSIAAVLPISFGGLGLREIVFFSGSHWLGAEAEIAVLVSLVFYLITVLSSLAGGLFEARGWRELRRKTSKEQGETTEIVSGQSG
jgi:uncharacterized membrane protein YbhN (UPF0104 family)